LVVKVEPRPLHRAPTATDHVVREPPMNRIVHIDAAGVETTAEERRS
jgi:hypothetical protein